MVLKGNTGPTVIIKEKDKNNAKTIEKERKGTKKR